MQPVGDQAPRCPIQFHAAAGCAEACTALQQDWLMIAADSRRLSMALLMKHRSLNAYIWQHSSKQAVTSQTWLENYRHLDRLQADSMHNGQADSMHSPHTGSQNRLHTFCTLWVAPSAAAPRAALPVAALVRLAAGTWLWGEQLPLRRLPAAGFLLGEAPRPREGGPGEGPLPPRSPANLVIC